MGFPAFFAIFVGALIMNKNVQFTNKIGMTILNLKVKDFNRFVKLDQINTMNSSMIPISRINKVIRLQICCIYPALASMRRAELLHENSSFEVTNLCQTLLP